MMRTYSELTFEEQQSAHEAALNELLQAVVEGGLRFDDAKNNDDLQARIDRAGEKAEQAAART